MRPPPHGRSPSPLALNKSLLSIQCFLSSTTSSAAAAARSGITNADVHALLALQGALASMAGQLDYAKVMAKDALHLLEVHPDLPLSLSYTPPPLSKDTGPPQSLSYRQAISSSLRSLGLISSSQSDLPAALSFYEAAASNLSDAGDPVPVELQNRITGVHLALNDHPAMVRSAAAGEASFLSNVASAMSGSDANFVVRDELFFVHNSFAGDCVNFLRDSVSYAAGAKPQGSIAFYMSCASVCLYGNPPGGSAKQLDSTDQFNLGRALQKRGYTAEGHRHLTTSSELFSRNSDVYSLYAKLVLPLTYGSSSEQALVYAGFRHELAEIVARSATATGPRCSQVTDFDMLPLVRYITDRETDVLDQLFSASGRNQKEILDERMSTYAKLSAAFVAICPELKHTNEVVDLMYQIVDEDSGQNFREAEKNRGEKVKVGIVSSKIYNHETLKLHGGLLEYLTRDVSKLEVKIACWQTIADEATKRSFGYLTQDMLLNFKNRNINTHQLVSASDRDEAFRTLEAANLDVILYLDLILDAKAFSLAHRRLAPVQVAIWGHHT